MRRRKRGVSAEKDGRKTMSWNDRSSLYNLFQLGFGHTKLNLVIWHYNLFFDQLFRTKHLNWPNKTLFFFFLLKHWLLFFISFFCVSSSVLFLFPPISSFLLIPALHFLHQLRLINQEKFFRPNIRIKFCWVKIEQTIEEFLEELNIQKSFKMWKICWLSVCIALDA